jgi:large subunit ribosomal protein L17
MRHGKKINHLGRKSAHRHALLSNMASSLILHKRITTTVAKAKALRKYVEPLLTKSKDDTTHSRRTVFAYLQNKESIKTLFGEVAGRIATRAGGYTRIIKLGDPRLGDAADMCIMELVDFNDLYKKDGAEKKAKTRRGRKGKKEEGVEDAEVVTDAKEDLPTGQAGKPKKAAKKTKKEE